MAQTEIAVFARGAALMAALALSAVAQTGTPDFVVGYSLQPLNNAVMLANGATITFPNTQIGATAAGALIIGNLGTAAGAVTSIVVTGAAFNTQSLPLLPVAVAAGGQMSVPLIYTPTAAGSDSGTLTVTAAGQTFTARLSGSGIISPLQFRVTAGGQTTAATPSSLIAIPDTPLGSNSIVSVTVSNAGSSTVAVSSIAVSGSAYQLTSAPPVPLSLAPGASAVLSFTFTPSAATTFPGNLVIGSFGFSLSGRGLGPLLEYAWSSGGTVSSVAPGGAVYFPQAAQGQSSSAVLTVTNAGTASGSIAGIYIAGQNSPFALAALPVFPLALAPGQTTGFQITFTPSAAGGATANLSIDGAQFTLAGSASPLPPFPAWSFNGASGTLTPLEQVPVSLSLAAPYPIGVSGTLTMSVLPQGFSPDPAIQFATGGKTVAFTIPANSTSAIFANGATSVKLQTGSTAGTITITPTFQTQSGAPLAPTSGAPLQLNVPASAPALIGAQIVGESATGVTVAVTGVTNTESLNHIDFQFTPASGYSLKNNSVSVPVSAAATAFFASAASANFGGQFVATIPFNLTTGSGVTNAVSLLQSLTITATNDQGTSSAYTLKLQ